MSHEIQRITLRKLNILAYFGHNLYELKKVLAADLKLLTGDKKGIYRIKINDQFRITFKWKEGIPYNIMLSKHYGD